MSITTLHKIVDGEERKEGQEHLLLEQKMAQAYSKLAELQSVFRQRKNEKEQLLKTSGSRVRAEPLTAYI
jgi:hypothetical protein